MHGRLVALGLILLAGVRAVIAADRATVPEYLRLRTERCARQTADHIAQTLASPAAAWPERRAALRAQLQDMLGLKPLPPRGALHATVTGQVEREGIVVEKLHFQSSPGLYVTASFYRPQQVDGPLPTVLYLCGHARVVENGVSMGNKAGYQHHGAWLARNGYCCLTIDTLQLGEIQGVHHGTYREGRWWWIARGYTPAGVEAWNAIRALDYLETRPEVDRQRLGVTGRSGGGAYSWWLAALDDRPICFVPVAGITDLENHVVDGCIEGHCDCMFPVNRQGWDFGTVASLVAPRACLLANSDRDRIFPLAGVLRIQSQIRQVYRHLEAEDALGLLITTGPHEDTQDLQVPAFRWLNRWLRGTAEPVAGIAEKLFAPAELKVFDELPADERNTQIDESFVPAAQLGAPPGQLSAWQTQRQAWLAALATRCFSGSPEAVPLDVKVTSAAAESGEPARIEFTSEPGLRLSLEVSGPLASPAERPLVLHLVDENGATLLARTAAQTPAEEAWAFFAPRAAPAGGDEAANRSRDHFLRRLVLVGTTLDEARVWDVRRALAALRETELRDRPVLLAGQGTLAGVALYAALEEPGVVGLDLEQLPASHRHGPIFMNVLRVLDLPQALALAFPRPVMLRQAGPADWQWTDQVGRLYQEDGSLLTLLGESPSPNP